VVEIHLFKKESVQLTVGESHSKIHLILATTGEKAEGLPH